MKYVSLDMLECFNKADHKIRFGGGGLYHPSHGLVGRAGVFFIENISDRDMVSEFLNQQYYNIHFNELCYEIMNYYRDDKEIIDKLTSAFGEEIVRNIVLLPNGEYELVDVKPGIYSVRKFNGIKWILANRFNKSDDEIEQILQPFKGKEDIKDLNVVFIELNSREVAMQLVTLKEGEKGIEPIISKPVFESDRIKNMCNLSYKYELDSNLYQFIPTEIAQIRNTEELLVEVTNEYLKSQGVSESEVQRINPLPIGYPKDSRRFINGKIYDGTKQIEDFSR